MNPFELLGPEFLAFYTVLLAGAWVVTSLLARSLAGRGQLYRRDLLPEEELHPYEVAYLAGGDDLAVEATLASLIHNRKLDVEGGTLSWSVAKRSSRSRGEASTSEQGSGVGGASPAVAAAEPRSLRCPVPEDAHPLERTVALNAEGRSANDVVSVCRGWTRTIDDRLVERGLVATRGARQSIRGFTATTFLVVAVVGGAKILIGLSRGRPVLFLVCLTGLAVFLGFRALIERQVLTDGGRRALEMLRERNAALRSTAESRVSGLTGHEVALALALFGWEAVAQSKKLADVKLALHPPPPINGGSSGCGSSCGGGCGGGGGGGCGGCGGH
jgi:uncharacterized protein (TIGR04222 family)